MCATVGLIFFAREKLVAVIVRVRLGFGKRDSDILGKVKVNYRPIDVECGGQKQTKGDAIARRPAAVSRGDA